MALAITSRTATIATQPTAVLSQALRDFEEVLTTAQKQEYAKICTRPDAQSVVAFVTQVDSQNNGRTRRCFAPRLCSFLDATEQFVGVVETFVSSNPTIAALVWGGVKTAVLVASNVASYFEKITEMIMSIGKSCPTFEKFGLLYPTSVNLQATLCDYYAVIIRLCAKIIEVSQRTSILQTITSVFQPFESEFKPFREQLDATVAEIQMQITLASNEAANEEAKLSEKERKKNAAHRQSVLKFQKKSREEDEKAKESRIASDGKRVSQIRSEISKNLTDLTHVTPWKQAVRKRLPETAEWFKQDPAFLDWMSARRSVTLWCSGKMGTGKTILAANVVAHIAANRKPTDVVAYSFCQADIPISCQARQVIGSIAAQMLESQMRKLDDGALAKMHQESRYLDSTDLIKFLLARLHPNFTYYLVLDGLDECESVEVKMIARAVDALLVNQNTECKIFCSGRPQLEQTLLPRHSPTYKMSLNQKNVEHDIQKFIEISLAECLEERKLKLADPRLILNIRTALEDGANGMILWARLLIEEICCQNSDQKIRQALHNLPKTLSELFDQKIDRVKSRPNSEDALKILQFCGVAKRPLTTDEARELLTIAFGQSSLDFESLSNDIGQTIADCCGLVDVDEEDASIHYVHHSVYQHLFDTRPLGSAPFDKMAMDKHLGLLCLTYINFSDFQGQLTKKQKEVEVKLDPLQLGIAALAGSSMTSNQLALKFLRINRGSKERATDLNKMVENLAGTDKSPRSQFDLISRRFQFLFYACQYWIFHLGRLTKTDNAKLWSVFCQCVDGTIVMVHRPWENLAPVTSHELDWKEGLSNEVRWSLDNHHTALLTYKLSKPSDDQIEGILCQMAITNDTYSLKALLNNDVKIGIEINQALVVYAGYGSKSEFEALLAMGADPNSRLHYHTALSSAASSGNTEFVEILLDAGADVTASPRVDGDTALQRAARGGHMDVVERLLAAGADVNASARRKGDTALQIAARRGHVDMVERLLAAGADVTASSNVDGDTALQIAARRGYINVVERLLATGADVTASSSVNGDTPLQIAARSGHVDVVERLLAAGADVNAFSRGSYGDTALYSAAGGGHIDVVERLLAAGADVNASARRKGGTALQAAKMDHHDRVVALLKSAGAKR